MEERSYVEDNSSSSNDVKKMLPLIYIPPEEFFSIRKEFFSQMTYLFNIMRKVDSRGFMFRLDFNGFLSKSIDSEIEK